MADETRVIVRVNALLPRQARGGGDRVGGSIAPGILIVSVIVMSRPSRLITWVWVGFVTETIVGMNRFVYDAPSGRLRKPAPSA